MRNVTSIGSWAAPLLVVCLIAVGAAHAAEPQAGLREIVSLAGTTWSGTDSDGDHYVFTFEHDGTLAYKSPTGSYRNGTWNQFNNAVHFEMNNHHSEYLGEIIGGNIEGKAWNEKRRVWLWKISKSE